VGDRVFKFKKPVDLGFLDFTGLEQRRQACAREVELNRRIAPDVYQGIAHMLDVDGSICEYFVVMQRMPADRRLAQLVCTGEPVQAQVRQIARQVAAFHSTARRAPEIAAEGTRDAIRGRWHDTFRQLRALRMLPLGPGVLEEVEALTNEFLDGRADLFDARVAAGRVVDGHGDLLADDIFCLPDGPRILDCIEFDDRLRWLDQLDDAAFLAMDLEYLGAADLARQFLDWYVDFTADPAPAALRHHFLAYRAFVRAKVACFRGDQGDAGAAEIAQRHAQLALDHLHAGVVSLVVVGGLPGTGKSTLSSGLADAMGAVVVSTDRVRKELAGLSPDTSAAAAYGEGIYSREWTERVYAEVLHRAGQLLRRGESVILDASWTASAHRADARALAGRVTEIRCVATSGVAGERIRTRTRMVSDADEAVAAAMATTADPWPQAAPVDTTQPVAAALGDALRIVAGSRLLLAASA
jgi:aminoglycoside phosphotransferase family enzyme/predicted kinase